MPPVPANGGNSTETFGTGKGLGNRKVPVLIAEVYSGLLGPKVSAPDDLLDSHGAHWPRGTHTALESEELMYLVYLVY